MKNFIYAATATTLLLIMAAALSSCAPVPEAPAVIALSFRAADNAAAGLGVDVEGVIDEETDVITVRLPDTVTDYSSLVARVSASEGNTVLPALPTDFSRNPTALTVGNDLGEQRTYLVDLGPVAEYAAADAMLFTEYYAGTGYDLSGDKNRWIEITNRSTTETVDLAQYELVKYAREDGLRIPFADQRVRLRGSLTAGASLVLYAERLKTSRFGLPGSVSAPSLIYSDLYFNGIIDFDGDDGYQLVRDGVVLDILGPNGGTGATYNWGREKRMLRKSGVSPSTTWKPLDWISYGLKNNVEDAVNTGSPTPALASDAKVLTFFAFENQTVPSYGIIDASTKTVSIAVPQGTDLSAVIVSVGVEGAGAVYAGKAIQSGVTAIDFTAPVSIRVYPTVGTAYDTYSVEVVFSRIPEYTTAPFPFDGGIAALKAKLTYPETSFAPLVVEGIVTARNVYFKYSTGSDECFFIQDSTGGVLVWSDVGFNEPIGSRVRVEVIKGVSSYTMPLVYQHGAITRVDADTYDIHYDTGAYNSATALGKVYEWTGSIASGMADYDEGIFSGALMFQGVTALADLLETGDTATYYGPVQVSYSKYKMCLSDPEQIRP